MEKIFDFSTNSRRDHRFSSTSLTVHHQQHRAIVVTLFALIALQIGIPLQGVHAQTCTMADCSYHASAVVWNGSQCVCTCTYSWQGSQCQDCPVRYNIFNDCSSCNEPDYAPNTSYPTCVYNKCSRSEDCIGTNTRRVTGTKLAGCKCQCRNQYTGTRCETCPPQFDSSDQCGSCTTGYSGYPDCGLTCTVAANCSGNANSVSGTSLTGCTCTCANKWTGGNCNTCPTGYNASLSCGACSAGYGGYPSCSRLCTTATDCSGHASSVTGRQSTGCTCVCRNKWKGTKCTECPAEYNKTADCGTCAAGYGGYPNCARLCNYSDCSDHANSVSGNIGTGCTCTCRNQWTNATCGNCPHGYAAKPDCSNCITGYSGYPICKRTCTTTEDCSNHATGVSGTEGSCVCTCRNKWQGSKCSVCTLPFSGTDCDRCAGGYVGYPNCIKDCNKATDCNSHATHVQGYANGTCKCHCRNQWAGAKCSTCPAKYARNQDCGACAPAYNVSTYPACYLLCTNQANCSGNAVSVDGDTQRGCSCFCKHKWQGPTCSVCPTQYDASQNCSSCVSTREDFPNCYLKCTSAANCSNRATTVTGNTNAGCNCTCRTGWSGSSCETCPPTINPLPDCNSCKSGYESFPGCYLTCTTQANCSNHATSVTGNTNTGCTCSCRKSWTGNSCQTCPQFYNSTDDCGSCVSAYGGYPNCKRICTIPQDCSSHATGVSGLEGNCQCTCKNQWTSSDCSQCATRYFKSNDCGSCASGYDTYPHCYLTCTVQSNCTNHASNVTGNSKTGCTCSCRNKWYGAQCQSCPSNFDSSQDCGACATGYDNYPICARICTSALDCNAHAASVAGLVPSCNCTCRNSWTGATCADCAGKYNSSVAGDCGTCATGYKEYSAYPQCYKSCSVVGNCSNHATTVQGNIVESCTCTCRNQWTGTQCQTCIANYSTANDCGTCASGYIYYPQCPRACTNQTDCSRHSTAVRGGDGNCTCTCMKQYTGPSCNRCAPGYDNYPTCARICTSTLDCNSQASNVSGLVPNCQCTCRHQWIGSTCNTCPTRYDPNEDCSRCATGYKEYSAYPQCYKTCSKVSNCSNHATSVVGNQVEQCNCTCRNQWTGNQCQTCIANYSTANDCGTCASGYIYYPQCPRACTDKLDCNSHSVAVAGGDGSCTCTCKTQYSGPRCGQCAPGYDNYPTCPRICTTAQDCSGQATNVTGLVPNCKCTCRNQWYGSSCNQCQQRYNSTADCGTCATGYKEYSTYPQCYKTCSMASNCSGHATEVAGNQVEQCNCTCVNQWSGNKCQTCIANYSTANDCGTCASGYIYYPQCPRACTDKLDCASHSVAVEGGDGNCTCTCMTQYAGPGCNRCAPAYDNYPTCPRICTIGQDCSGQATNVTGLVPNCKCTCRNQWYGSSCNQCHQRYNRTADCGTCAPGYKEYSTYPQCYRTCSLSANCSSHATAVVGNQVEQCNCTCRNQWTGTQCQTCIANYSTANDCGTCASGYIYYPQCPRACTNQTDCSRHSTAARGGDGNCTCTCMKQYTGPSCNRCAPGHDNYPVCARICTIAQDCSGQATNVTGLVPNCKCTCRNQWYSSSCNQCHQRYNRTADCGTCAPGYKEYSTYPQCYKTCSLSANCSSHATAVVGNQVEQCNCTCRNQWTGNQCQTCIANYSTANDCGTCASGYIYYPQCPRACTNQKDCSRHSTAVRGGDGNCTCTCMKQYTGPSCNRCAPAYDNYPTCPRICTTGQDCSGQATNVSGLDPNCKCTCRNQWYGLSCNQCHQRYIRTADCGTCAPGYKEYSTYPQCYKTCSNVSNCSNHATAVVGNQVEQCNCTCRNQWTGNQCQTCGPFLNASADCGVCITGHILYPRCPRACTNSQDCAGNAWNVTGAEGTCDCKCRNQWSNSSCNVCPPRYKSSTDCGSCRTIYDNNTYPTCYLLCTRKSNCSNHATTVTGNTNTGCNCTCRNLWYGDTCDHCPSVVNASKDCGQCIDGYDGYPDCRRICTSKLDCDNHARLVNGLLPNCTCTCRNMWKGDSCTTCAAVYNASNDCGTCVKSREQYPLCYRTCTAVDDCTNHSVAVRGNEHTGCNCTCRHQWQLANCSHCPHRYNSSNGNDCDRCAEGYAEYPTCARICTNVTDCSGHAANVSGLFPSCNCICRNGWTGSDCSICPAKFDRANDCFGCDKAYEGTYPECYLTCTAVANCSDNAIRVVGNTKVGCNCTCRNMWNSSNCSSCAPKYDKQQDCGSCDYGYEDYPKCKRACTTYYECSNHAHSVTGRYPNCTCACSNMWKGTKCGYCPTEYNPTANCGSCVSGRMDYPKCTPACTVKHNCSNHAHSTTGSVEAGCNCTCRSQWYGDKCQLCPPLFDPTQDCAACIPGYGGYPQCTPVCTNRDCYNRSLSVKGNTPNCRCFCTNHYAQPHCGRCPLNYNASENCIPCAVGYETPPHCYRICTDSYDCSNHSTQVSGNEHTGCQCTCRHYWNGSDCGQCPRRYNASMDCNACSAGHVNYPRCDRVCTVAEDCTGQAVKVTGLEGHCNCTCRNQWEGPRCTRCPIIFDNQKDCGACAPWVVALQLYEPYPNCTALITPPITPTLTLSETDTMSFTDSVETITTSVTEETTSLSLSHGTESHTETESLSLSLSQSDSDLSVSASSTATGESKTTSPESGSKSLSRTTTASLPNGTNTTGTNGTNTTASPLSSGTPVPSPTTTTESPVSTNATTTNETDVPSTTGVPVIVSDSPSSTSIPSATDTDTPNTSTTTESPVTTTTSVPVTQVPMPTGPCKDVWPCNTTGTAAVQGNQSPDCSCSCRTNFRGPYCGVCDPWYNLSTGCDQCSEGHVNYPHCWTVAHVVGNLTIAKCSSLNTPSDGLASTVEVAVADDMKTQLLESLETTCFGNTSHNTSELVKVFVIRVITGVQTTSFEFDIEVWNQTAQWATWVTSCVAEELNKNQGVGSSLSRARDSLIAQGHPDLAACFATAGAFLAHTTLLSPCGEEGCAAAVIPTTEDEEDSEFPLWALAIIIPFVVLAALFVGRRFTVRMGRRETTTWQDSSKYTISFLDQYGDQELRLLSQKRDLDWDDI